MHHPAAGLEGAARVPRCWSRAAGWDDPLPPAPGCCGGRHCCRQARACPGRRVSGSVWLPRCRAVAFPLPWKLAARTETKRLNHRVHPGGGKGRKGAVGSLPAPHPALPRSSQLPGLSQRCPPCVGLAPGWGTGLSPPTPGQGSGLGAELKWGQRWWQGQPVAPLRGAGLSCPLGGMGFVTDGSQPPSGAWQGAAGGTRARISGNHSAQRAGITALGGQRLVYLPNKPGAGGTGPTGPPPCSDARLGTASPRQPQTHVGAHGSLRLLCQSRDKPFAAPGQVPPVPSLLPPQMRAASNAPDSTGQQQPLGEWRCDPSSGQGCEHGHWPPQPAGPAEPGCWEVLGVQRWDAGA